MHASLQRPKNGLGLSGLCSFGAFAPCSVATPQALVILVSPEQVPRVLVFFVHRLSAYLFGVVGAAPANTRRFLPPDVENLRELRSERKGEKWIRAGVHALASFAAAGVMDSWWSPIGVEAGGRWSVNRDPGHGGCL